MADNTHEIELIISARERARDALRNVRADLHELGETALRVGRRVAFVAGILGGAFLLLADRGAKVESVAEVFETTADRVGMSSRELLSHLQAVTRGTVSNFQLMAQANAAIGTGALSLRDFSTALEFVGLKAKATGEDVDALTSKVVTGLLRGSVMLLDDALPNLTRELERLGVQGLSEAQRKAVTLQVAFRMMEAELRTLRLTTGDARDGIEQVQTTIGNLRDRLAQIIATSPAVRAAIDQVRASLAEGAAWIEANRAAIERWIGAALGLVFVAVQVAQATVRWVIAHRELLLQLAAVAAILALIGFVGRLTLALAQLAMALKAVGALFATTLGAGAIGAVVAGLAAIALAGTRVADAFRQAKIAMEGFDLAQSATRLRGLEARVTTRQTVAGTDAVIFERVLEGGNEIIARARALMMMLPQRSRSLLEEIIGRAEATRDLEEKARWLNILRDRAAALAEATVAEREADEERLRQLRRGLEDIQTSGYDFSDLEKLIGGLQDEIGPIDQLSQRLELLQVHFRMGEESGESYRQKLVEIQREARALADEHRSDTETMLAALQVWGRATDELERFREAEERARQASMAIAEPLVATIDLLEAMGRLGQLSSEEVTIGLESVKAKILELAQREDLTVEQTIALADALDRVNGALDRAGKSAEDFGKAVQGAVAEGLTATLREAGDTLAEFFASMFGAADGAEAPLKRFLAAVLDILGNMLIALGTTAIMTSQVITGLLAAIASMNPAAGLAVGAAAIALGALLKGASAALMSSVQRAAGGGAPSSSGAFRVNLPDREREPDTIVNVYVVDELGERRVQRLQKKLSQNQRRDVSLRVPIGG
jgi:hypothetical protein